MTNVEFGKNFARFARSFAKDTKSTDEVCQTQKIQMGEMTFSRGTKTIKVKPSIQGNTTYICFHAGHAKSFLELSLDCLVINFFQSIS